MAQVLFFGLSSRRSGFNSRPFRVMFIVDIVTRRQVFLRIPYSPPQPTVSLHHCSKLISFLILLLSEGQAGETWGTFEQSNTFSDIGDFTSQNNIRHQKEFIILYVLFFINVYMVLFLFDNVIYVFLLLWLCILIVCLCMATLTEGFPCFFRSCKANARVKPAKTGHGQHSS